MASNSNAENATLSPNSNLDIPQWIDADYLEQILHRCLPNFVRLLEFETVAATAPGENYCSIMIRLVVTMEMKDKSILCNSYILKTNLDNDGKAAAIINSMGVFPKEKHMYETIIPQFVQLYKEVGVHIQFSPQCLYINESMGRITLMMEDLKSRHFVNANRLSGLDEPHMICVLRKLAEFHAVSARYYELNGCYDKHYDLSFYNETNRTLLRAFAESRRKLQVRAMREWDMENIDYYIEKLPPVDASFNEGIRINTVDPSEFNVLNHGDCWVNNIMFRHKESGEIEETIFVDFQLGKWGTPAQDLWYLIVTSAAHDIRVTHFDRFIRIYYERLVECLRLLKHEKNVPTLRELHKMLLKYGYWGLAAANGVLSVVVLPSDKDANIENLVNTEKESEPFRYNRLINPIYVKAMQQLYPFFDNKGLLYLPSHKCT